MAAQTVCLNMIVKNEAHVIERCLSSLRGAVDYWVIVDTGSTDDTARSIERALDGIPGELHHREWRDFATNRTQALELATGKTDYLLLIDADEELELPPGHRFVHLDSDAYEVLHTQGDSDSHTYLRNTLIRNDGKWRYKGVLHEYLEHDGPHTQTRLTGPRVRGYFDGGRSQIDVREKYAADANVLEKALVDEPGNDRYVFYLAQSYRDSEQFEKANQAYRRRATMGGWVEEVWYSLYEVALLSERLGRPDGEVIDNFLQAHEYRPTRAEALGNLARYLRERNRFASARVFALEALKISRPDDLLFLDEAYYSWRCLDELSIADYWLGNYRDSADACRTLLARSAVPERHKSRITDNLNFALAKL